VYYLLIVDTKNDWFRCDSKQKQQYECRKQYLSEKVARTLQVRTDTPAMKAALDALSRLPDAGEMDSRSVRVAIERDALTPSPVFTRRITNAC
jgi:hypothetical protein